MFLNARQPGKVFDGLNAWQSEIFTDFPLKDSFKLLDGIWCLFRNAEQFQNDFSVQDDEITLFLYIIF